MKVMKKYKPKPKENKKWKMYLLWSTILWFYRFSDRLLPMMQYWKGLKTIRILWNRLSNKVKKVSKLIILKSNLMLTAWLLTCSIKSLKYSKISKCLLVPLPYKCSIICIQINRMIWIRVQVSHKMRLLSLLSPTESLINFGILDKSL